MQHIPSTAYHPKGNGLVERLHRCLKDALWPCCSRLDWPNHLPWVLLVLRTAPQEDDAFFPAQTVYSVPLTLPVDRLDERSLELPLQQALQTLRITCDTATLCAMCHNTPWTKRQRRPS